AWVRTHVATLLGAAAGAHVSIGRIGGTLGHSLVLDDVRVSVARQPVLGVTHAAVTYSLGALLRGRILLRRVTLRGLHVRLVRDAHGWRLPRLAAAAGPPLEVRQLRVEGGRVGLAVLDAAPPQRLVAAALTFVGAAAADGARLQLRADALDFTLRGMARGRVHTAGRLVGEPGGRLLAAAAAQIGAAGTLSAAVRVAPEATPPATVRAAFRDLDPAAVLPHLPHARLQGALRASGTGVREPPLTYRIALGPSTIAERPLARALVLGRSHGPLTHARARLAAAGAAAVVRAAALLGAVPRYRAQADLDVGDLGALGPLPPGRAAGRVALRGVGPLAAPRAEATLRLAGAEVHGVVLRSGTVAVRLDGRRLEVTQAQADGPALAVEATGMLDAAARRGEATLAARADLGRLGEAVGIPALDAVAAEMSATVGGARWHASAADALTVEATLSGLGGRAPAGRARLAATSMRFARWPAVDLPATLAARRAEARTLGDLEALTLAPAGMRAWTLAAPARWSLADALEVAPLTLTSGAGRGAAPSPAGVRSGRRSRSMASSSPSSARSRAHPSPRARSAPRRSLRG